MDADGLDPASGRGWGRRSFAGGVLGVTGALALGVAAFAPDWGGDAPVRPARVADALPEVAMPTPPTPRVVEHGAGARTQWAAFRHRYITPEGRVIDTGNGNVSHSEGQGWALMGAQACDDPDTFAAVLAWTTSNLRRRPGDGLHAWRYKPGDANPVSDLNNATDGDLFIAAALARAALRWNRPDYAAQAARLAADIAKLTRRVGARTVLLPGAAGFETGDAVTVNPSYYAFALFPDLAPLAPSPVWEALRRDGLALLLQGRYGRWSLPPDWLRVARADGGLSIAPGWPPRFSWDAIRVPLHLAWAGMPAAPLLEGFQRYWTGHGPNPAWVDLRTDAVAPYGAPVGVCAVAALAARALKMGTTAAIPPVISATDYYSAGLALLSHLASGESRAVS